MNIEEKEQTEKGRSEKQKSSSTAKAERDPERPQRGIKIVYRKRSRKTPQYTRRFQKNLNSISNHPGTAQ